MDSVDVVKSRVLCKEECTGTVEDLELQKDESHLYIIDAFSVVKGKGTIQNAMVIRRERPPPPPTIAGRGIGQGLGPSPGPGLGPNDTGTTQKAFLKSVKLTTTQGETISCICSFTMQLTGDKMDAESKLEVDVEKSRLLCKEECTGTSAAEVELDDKESHLLYIIDTFTVVEGRGTIQSAMVIRKRPPPPPPTIAGPGPGLGPDPDPSPGQGPKDTCTTHTQACQDAFLGVRGFCGERSIMGGNCSMADQPGGEHYCPGNDCTCCKECLDVTNKCSARGPGWSCYNTKAALALPQGSCNLDRSCSSAPDSPYTDSSCVCCKPPVNPCEDYGCSAEWEGMGACVNLTEVDWASVDNSFNLSVPAIPGKCGPDCPESYCVCLKKKELCADQGCSSFFGGFGVCFNVFDPEFSATSLDIDFTAGGREDLCAGCCSCFKKRN